MNEVSSRSRLLAFGGALFAFLLSDATAQAQYYPSPRYGYDPYPPGYVPRGYGYDRGYYPRREYDYDYRRRPPTVRDENLDRPSKAKRERFDEPKPDLAAKPSDKPVKGPYHIVISINAQHVSLYGSDGLIRIAAVSTGMRGHPTPQGVFTVIGKERFHRSNIYSNAPMPFMQRVTWSGVALHEGVLPGYPASHGCIRMGSDFAVYLWKTTKIGTRVIITNEDPVPAEISNAKLFSPAPAPQSTTLAVAADGKGAANAAKIAARSESDPGLLVMLNDGPAEPAAQTLFEKRKFDRYRNGPVSVFVSRKTNKLYVRYDYEPLFEAPVTIKNPERPLGTHVYTAMEATEGGVRWTSVSIPTPARGESEALKPKKGERITAALTETDIAESRETQTAQAALDRIEMPKEAVERISAILSVGSSLTISDYGISDETGRETDFIILTK